MLLIFGLSLYLLLAPSLAYPTYQEYIPNGDAVPHPCQINTTWHGVGHKNPKGGGERNHFGLDFKMSGLKWTRELCQKDSDGDGRSNGEELGDPTCVWLHGQNASRTVNITHPGICDPYDSDSCKDKNSFVSCQVDNFDTCAALNNPAVQTIDLRLSETRVPSTSSNYYCMIFDLPSDQDYHVVAYTPIIDNYYVLHHIVLYGCASYDTGAMPTSQACGGMGNQCSAIILGWLVGESAKCYAGNIGNRIGLTSFKRVRMEVHYNNPTMIQGIKDTSGLRLYYQPARPDIQDLITFTLGQRLLEIPPGQTAVEHAAVCPSNCTSRLINRPVNIIRAHNHMHLLGKAMKIEVFRDGAKIKDLINADNYNYNAPYDHVHDPPFVLLPTDEVKTTCVYNSSGTKEYTFYGDALTDEMCYGTIDVYPREAISSYYCVSFGSLSACNMLDKSPIGQCDWATFTNFSANAKIVNDVMNNCNLDRFCRPECRDVLKDLDKHPCMNGEAFKYVTFQLQDMKEGLEFLARLQSCPLQKECEYVDKDGEDAATRMTATSLICLLAISYNIYILFL